jgi:uracil-DNA glycosylase
MSLITEYDSDEGEVIIPKRWYIKKRVLKDFGLIYKLVQERPEDQWTPLFEKADPELRDISSIISERCARNCKGIFYPYTPNIFKVFDLCKPEKIKVVILGQDPYHNLSTVANEKGLLLPNAVGLSFSVPPGAPVPPSLKNIYKVLEKTVKGFVAPNHGDLTEWVKRGVFLLNTALTVEPGTPGSHIDVWKGFISHTIEFICERTKPVFLLWGKPSQQWSSKIPDKCPRLITSHPSPFSATRGFLVCNHFVEANEILKSMGRHGVKWKSICM